MILINWLSQVFWSSWAYFWSGRTFAIVLGVGFAVLAFTLLILSRTRWGHTKPLTKCVVLSVLAHVWLIMYAMGNRLVLPQGHPRGSDRAVYVTLDHAFADLAQADSADQDQPAPTWQPWEAPVPSHKLPVPELIPLELDEGEATATGLASNPSELKASSADSPPTLADEITLPPLLDVKDSKLTQSNSIKDVNDDRRPVQPTAKPDRSPVPVEPQSQADSSVRPEIVALPVVPPALAVESALTTLKETAIASESVASSHGKTSEVREPAAPFRPAGGQQTPNTFSASSRQAAANPQVPVEYQMRQAPNRLQLAMPYGADADSEAAVERALTFLASAQSPDGAWNAKQFGAGTETRALGENRFGTGDRADTGVSGLALLSFLAGGHTHKDGQHSLVVRRGLEFLLRAQAPSGDLSGPKQIGHEPSVTNAKMYCHGIATLAMAEAFAMTHDPALQHPLMMATRFTLSAQDKRSGGWRYRPGDPGDLSQFGWQVMALRSAELSGLPMQSESSYVDAKSRMQRFIDSCSAGKHGGLARYRPTDGIATSTMTAEGLACRYLMNWPLGLPAQREAEAMLMSNLPGVGQDNVYYWYYATLALFQLQNDSWRQWNQALKAHLLKTQIPSYQPQPGSWTPDELWGGYGGRIYSTAMSCLCLEVYYRYLPMYQRSHLAQVPVAPTSR